MNMGNHDIQKIDNPDCLNSDSLLEQTLWISSEKVLDSDRDEVVARGEFENFVNFLRRLLAVFDNNSDCKGRNS